MINVLTGANDYARQERKRSILDAFITDYSTIALEVLDGEDVEFDRISEAVNSLPFLAQKKMVVLYAPSASKQFLEQFEALLSDVPETTELLIDEPKFDKRSSYYKYCKKLDGFEVFDNLDSPALQRWAEQYVKKWEAAIESAAARELVQRCNGDQYRLANELDKLCMYSSKITKDDITELTVKAPSSTIFELIDAAFGGNKKRALALYEEQRALQVDPIQIVAMFTWQFHVLATVKAAQGMNSGDVAKQAKLNPYVVQKTGRLASAATIAEVKNHVRALRELDERMKSSRINSDDALKAFIISL